MRGVDHDDVDAGIDQQSARVEALLARRRRGGDAQPALLRPWRHCGWAAGFSMSFTVMRPMQR